jgi:predicted transcriptional regulator
MAKKAADVISLEARADAIARGLSLVEGGASANQAATEIAEDLGVKRQTVLRWCRDAGTPLGDRHHAQAAKMREVAAAEFEAKRAELRVRLLDSALSLVERIEGARDSDVNKVAVATGIMVDKMRLEMGEATDRHERIDIDTIDQEIRRLETELAAGASEAGD